MTDTLQFDELEEGQQYHVIMSQGNGLLRLWTGDIFRVVENRHGLPWLRFIERYGVFHSFTGEKLTHNDIAIAFESVFIKMEKTSKPYMIGPEWGEKPRYAIAIESSTNYHPAQYQKAFDQALSTINLEYASKRESGRLDPPKIKLCSPNSLRKFHEISRIDGNQNQFKFQNHQASAEFFYRLEGIVHD